MFQGYDHREASETIEKSDEDENEKEMEETDLSNGKSVANDGIGQE